MFSNTPLLLTWLRIVLIPVFVAVYYLPDAWLSTVHKNWTAMWIFAIAATTDWLDGYLARRWGEVSAFGAFLDPVADKLMVAAALIVLVWIGRADAYLAIVIIGREIAISALREWMAQLGQHKSIAVAFIGKVKTVAQMTGDHRAAPVGGCDPGRVDAACSGPSRCGLRRYSRCGRCFTT
jgi:CDP-diacylglycerol--glycerol-3-phosphate 3-phosphatidyltransferase